MTNKRGAFNIGSTFTLEGKKKKGRNYELKTSFN